MVISSAKGSAAFVNSNNTTSYSIVLATVTVAATVAATFLYNQYNYPTHAQINTTGIYGSGAATATQAYVYAMQ